MFVRGKVFIVKVWIWNLWNNLIKWLQGFVLVFKDLGHNWNKYVVQLGFRTYTHLTNFGLLGSLGCDYFLCRIKFREINDRLEEDLLTNQQNTLTNILWSKYMHLGYGFRVLIAFFSLSLLAWLVATISVNIQRLSGFSIDCEWLVLLFSFTWYLMTYNSI